MYFLFNAKQLFIFFTYNDNFFIIFLLSPALFVA